MHCKQLVSATLALLLGAGITQADVLSHGDVEDYDGGQIKWHQVGKGMWSGVPIDEWDDEIHKRSEVDHMGSTEPVVRPRNLELEARNFESFCQAVQTCVTQDGLVQLTGCMGAYVEAAAAVAGTAQTIFDLLGGRAFVATVNGATVAGILTHWATTSSDPDPGKECSTSGTDKDALLSALSAALERAPDGYSVSVDVKGPTASYSITVNAAPQDEKPPTPVGGQCWTA